MQLPLPGIRYFLFFIFMLSGFSGLIYESIWSHYLKLFLGHAAYAQTLVIAIFMGGLAIGSWLSSRYSLRWRNVLLGYALAEGIIGVLAIIFHPLFIEYQSLAYEYIIPGLGSPALVVIFKWLTSALIILPQSILLGMTFPLMSAGIIRVFPERPGATLAILYFTNSIGAAIGVLASGFWLIKLMGLPGTIILAGSINIALAAVVSLLVMGQRARFSQLPGEIKNTPASASKDQHYRLLLAVAFFTGLASFIYEIGWIRMLALVLGSSTHAFELMLSAFILGLALGGLWIRRRIDQIRDTVKFLAVIQVIMGLLALATLPLYNYAFDLMHLTLKILTKADEAYTVFNLFSHFIALGVMLPATFCAGMTLPLITYILLKRNHGEKSIGEVYASNTIGGLLGVFFAVHVGMPVLGLKGLITLGAGLDIGIGLVLMWLIMKVSNTQKIAATVSGAVAILAVLVFVEFDSFKMASGVYMRYQPTKVKGAEVLFHKDGKTASIDIVKYPNEDLYITTNGKPESGINLAGGVNNNEPLMILGAAIPLALNPSARRAATIGMGAGLTSHTLLTVPWLDEVDTIEIEPAMVEAANEFRPRNVLVYTDPRSHIRFDDAKTYFSSQNKKYDIIVSESSNPWVSGISGLFSTEFYQLARRHMNDDGLLVQWLQLYEFDISLVVSVLKAISANFSDYVIYAAHDTSILIVARKKGTIPDPDFEVLQSPVLASELQHLSINTPQDFEILRLGGKKLFDPFIAQYRAPPNSDYYPFLDQNAAQARFTGSSIKEIVDFGDAPLPIIEMLDKTFERTTTGVSYISYLPRARNTNIAMNVRDLVLYETANEDARIPESVSRSIETVQLLMATCATVSDSDHLIDSLLNIAVTTIPYLTKEESLSIWEKFKLEKCNTDYTLTQQAWIDLFMAIIRRDAQVMADISTKLIKGQSAKNHIKFGYLLMAGMLGNLANNNKSEADELWLTYGKSILGKSQLDMLLTLLASHAMPDELRAK